MRKQQLFPFCFEKETPSVGKIENLLSQYNCYRLAICHSLVLLTFLLFGPIYRRNKSGCVVRVSSHQCSSHQCSLLTYLKVLLTFESTFRSLRLFSTKMTS